MPPNLTSDPGLFPGVDSMFNGDIGRKRKMIADARQAFLLPSLILIYFFGSRCFTAVGELAMSPMMSRDNDLRPTP